MKKHSFIRLEHVYWTYPDISRNQRTLKDTIIATFTKSKEDRKPRAPHLKDIDLSLNSGEKIGIVGPNGAGKSSLLRLISGVLVPDSGVVTVNGDVTPIMNLGSTLIPQVSCQKNAILALCAMGFNREDARLATEEIFAWSDLTEYRDDPFFSLSQGMQSRLLFAIATSQSPDIILIDEILSVGDSNFLQKARKRLDSFVSGGSILVAVSHDLRTLEEMTNEIIWMQKGTIYKRGPSYEMLREYGNWMI